MWELGLAVCERRQHRRAEGDRRAGRRPDGIVVAHGQRHGRTGGTITNGVTAVIVRGQQNVCNWT